MVSLLVAVAVDIFPDVGEACRNTIHITGRTDPGPASDVYERIYPHYRALYPSLSPTFTALGSLSE